MAALARADHRRHRTPATADPHTYDKVEAIERWMADPRPATPPTSRRCPPGPTPSTSFLFGSRRGFCEQISTATVVMLRSLGIPARETVGYVPGSYDPITDLYDVQAKDAHAWVQVWFPGYGWQNFDPTADVPLANPTPGSVLAHRRPRAAPAAVDPDRRGRGGRRRGGTAVAASRPRRRPPGPTRSPPTLDAGGARLGCGDVWTRPCRPTGSRLGRPTADAPAT